MQSYYAGIPTTICEGDLCLPRPLGIRTADDSGRRCVACVRAYENALSDARGRYIENPVYNIDESQAIEFDKKFEPKELVVGTPSQKRFDRIVAMRRKA